MKNHSVRFVRALVLAAALPGCSAAEDPRAQTQTEETEPTDPGARAPSAIAPLASASADAAAVVDAALPKTSGPIVPPELETA